MRVVRLDFSLPVDDVLVIPTMTATLARCVLAVDLGSGSVKVALVSSRGEVLSAAIRPIRTMLLPGGGAEQDPHEWWAGVVEATRSVLADSRVTPEQVLAIVCTSQWAVTVPVDEGGNALSNAISWMDTRGGVHTRAVVDGPLKVAGYDVFKVRKWLQLTGGAPVRSGVDGLGHVLHFMHDRPEVYRATHNFLEPMDYLNLRLTGRCAASYGTIYPYWLTDNRDPLHIAYAPALLRYTGIAREKMPDLLPVDAVLGTVTAEVASELGVLPTTRVLMGTCDGQAATVGAGALRDFEGYFYIGTTSWLSCHLPAQKTDVVHQLATMPAALPGRYMLVAEQGAAGRCLDFLKDNILFPGPPPDNVYTELDRAASSLPPGSDGLIFTPWLNGLLSPAADASTRSAFFNQSGRTTRAHYTRAVMEGVAYNLRWLKGYVEKFIGRPFQSLRFIGGAALSETWCQILADVLGCPVHQVADARNANAVGAALTAFMTLGELAIGDVESLVKVAAVYNPSDSNRRVYDRQFSEFVAFYRAVKPIYERLNATPEDGR
jgi:xylulokinase